MRFLPRDFWLFVIGQSISEVGDQAYLVALAWLVSERSGSAESLGLVLALAAIPRALLMPFGGALADRLSHRRLLLYVNGALALLLLALLGLALAGITALWPLAALAVLIGACEGLLTPAAFSMVPLLAPAETLAQANAIFMGGILISDIAGPALGGVILANGGGALAFGVDGLSFLAVVGVLLLMRPAAPLGGDRAGRASLLADLRPALASVRADADLALYVGLLLLGNLALAGPLEVGFVTVAQQQLRGGPELLGSAMSLFAAGSLLGTLAAGLIGRPTRSWRPLLAGILASGVLLGAVSLSVTAALFLTLAALLGGGVGLIDVLTQTGIQRRAPPAALGRVLGITLFAGKVAVPCSAFLAGLVAGRSVALLFLGAGALWVLSTVALIGLRRLAPRAA